MAHFIRETCIGCTACVKVCPTKAISGERQQLHVIAPELCIDCGACTMACPVECIENELGEILPRIRKRTDWPKPVIDPVNCTGCQFCVDVCPFHCLELEGDAFQSVAVLVDSKSCVGCGLCEEVCAKDAIDVRFPNGEQVA